MGVVAFCNGSFVEPTAAQLPIDERGHQFGDGVYEVVRVYGGRPFLLDMHLERLERSLAYVAIDNPYSRSEWIDLVTAAIARSQESESLVYWQVTRGVAPRAHLFPEVSPSVSLTVRPFAGRFQDGPIALMALPDERWANVFVKTINLLPNTVAKETAHRSDALEALLVRNGLVTEGSSSNVWFVRRNQLITAPANRYILNGISRQFTLRLAERLGYEVVEESLPWSEVAHVDEVFLTGTTIEVLPVDEVWVTDELEGELTLLPESTSASLVRECAIRRTVWASQGRSQIAAQLRSAYLDEVRRVSASE